MKWQQAVLSSKQVLEILTNAMQVEASALQASCLNTRAIRKLREIDLERARVHSNISMCHLSLAEATEALAAADAVIACNPRSAEAHVRRALALEELGKPAWAAADAAVQCAESTGEDAGFYKSLRQRCALEPSEPTQEEKGASLTCEHNRAFRKVQFQPPL